jgi:hypothetical protein|tara:strand:- start:809 stop:1243 length:435 start_codon:yes stop_codon:yes gene_type:complete
MKIEILPGLWLSDSKKLDNVFIDEKNIKNIINVDKDLGFIGNSNNYTDTIKENVEKYEILKMVNYLKEITLFIKNCLLKSENILIYCDTCIQKSPTLILAYLIRYGYLTKEIAIEMIRTKNINAFKPKLEYEKSIEIFTKQIKN